MEELNLTETEMRYFGDLFLCCDEDSNGKIPILKATELFRSSNIPNDILKQIMDISVAPNNSSSLNHMNRKQFYSALKLIAAHQQNLALKPDLISSSLDLSLPRFTWTLNCESNADLIQLSSSPKEYYNSKRDRSFGGNSHGNYEPIRLSSNLSDSDVPQTLSHDATEGISTDSEIESETLSQRSGSHGRRAKTGSPWSTASESPTPTNSVAEKVHPVWEHSATGRGVWPANTTEEHTQLLGTEEESSDRHSSDEEGDSEVWTISEVQARHYAAQFAQLRPERGLLSGPTARTFFEKSRLPVADLRKIWQLADITKDGALSLEEFSIAMHLIVLRRNSVPIPDVLPDLVLPPLPSPPAPPSPPLPPPPAALRSPPAPLAPAVTDVDTVANKQWTKFVDSPTSTVSSPGPKPVNFDFQKASVERDPLIYHPVAVRVTPDGTAPEEPELRSIQRPQPRKPVKSAGVLPPPPEPRKEPPPPPPPRPLRHHARSSSLDLTRLTTAPPPPPPPRSPDRPRMHGAFEVYRKPATHDDKDLKSLHDQNALLHRVCRALCADLADVQREKEALKQQLEGTNGTTSTSTVV